ncbi:HAD hydrolase-like protein [Planctomycetota bacterium]
MEYRLIIFDFDGTLGDTFPWFTRVLNQVADKYRFKHVTAAEVDTIRGYEGRQILKHLGVPVWKAPLIANYLRTLMTRDIREVTLFDGIKEMLHSLLNSGIELAVVSSNAAENIGYVLGQELATLFTHYECGVSMFGKERKLRSILKKSSHSATDAIYIGDEIRDLHSARKIGLAFGAVSWGYNKIEAIKIHHPDYIFETVTDITTTLIADH